MSSDIDPCADAGPRDARHGWIAAAYLFVGLIWLGSEGTYHGDERFYTDAVLRMLSSGDWLRPEYADGTARLNKPLLVYWLMGASCKVFGAGLFAARLPFLVAGALLVGVTGRLARALFPGLLFAPVLAAAIAASNSSLVTLSVRCTPDILLALSMAAAFVGLADFVVGRRAPRDCAKWLWPGIGLAAASKGSLAAALLVFALIAIALARRGARGWREIAHVPSLLAGVAIAVVSLAPLWLADDPGAGASFVKDQVSTRLAHSPLDALKLAGAYLGSLARHFLPWILAPLAALFVARERLAIAWRLHRSSFLLALAFAAAVLVLATCELRSVRIGLRIACAVVGVVSALAALLLIRIDFAGAAITVLGLAAAVAGVRSRACERSALHLALALAVVMVATTPAIRHAFRSSYWSRAAQLERLDATWGFDPSTPSVVRILAGGRLDPRPWPAQPDFESLRDDEAVLVIGPAAEELSRRGWTLEPCGFRAGKLRGGDVARLLFASDLLERFGQQGEPVSLALRAD